MESNCTPNSEVVPVMRATRPSSESKAIGFAILFDSRDAAVQRIEENGEADGFGGAVKLLVAAHQRGYHGVVAAQELGHGKHAGQEKNAAAQSGAAQTAFLEGNFGLIQVRHVRFASQRQRDFPRRLVSARASARNWRAAANKPRRLSRPSRDRRL